MTYSIKPLSAWYRQRALKWAALMKEGWTLSRIAEKSGLCEETVRNNLKRLEKDDAKIT